MNKNEPFSARINNAVGDNPLNGEVSRECCANTISENRRLKKALEKERNRRIYVFEAYKKLLDAYQSIVDLREVMDSSFSSSNTDQASSINGDDEEKENINQISTNLHSLEQGPHYSKLSLKNNYEIGSSHNNLIFSSKLPSSISKKTISSEKSLKTKPLDVALWSRKSYNYQHDTRFKQNTHMTTTVTMSSNEAYINTDNTNKDVYPGTSNNVKSPAEKEAEEVRRRQEWYFLKLEEDYANNAGKRDLLLQRSQERKSLIEETSRRRAAIAANRRAIAMDVLRGKRELDDEAVRILHTDSSTLSAFSKSFMKKMRSSSKKKYNESEKRFERERGNPREKQLQMATNKILAHSSAAITKTVAVNNQSRISRTFSNLNVQNCGSEFS